MYGVTLDYLTHEGNYKEKKDYLKKEKRYTRNKAIITLFSCIGAWFLSTIIFVCLLIYANIALWPLFTWAIPITYLLILIFNCICGKKGMRFL